ncbi:MAG: hypothetical protein NXI20_16715 [bacterium]|nr:hypothetical protein [bacterium]
MDGLIDVGKGLLETPSLEEALIQNVLYQNVATQALYDGVMSGAGVAMTVHIAQKDGDYAAGVVAGTALTVILTRKLGKMKMPKFKIPKFRKPKPKSYPEGSFSIRDWTGYPDGPKPKGPFRLLQGDEYESARKLANKTNSKIRRGDPDAYKGKEIHEIKPVKYDGSPVDTGNKIPLPRKEHAKYTTFWNRLMRDIQK